ncbi:MAG TPA: HPr kinase/phosphatase C-terminal domain-containing protein [Allosphingosinicella sp.]
MSETIHACCVAIGGRGVLIAGPSGTGKSDLALRLLDRGAVLVSDDYTLLEARDGRLFASPPGTIAGKVEIRGVGIVERPFLADIPVALLIDVGRPPERLPEAGSRTIGDITVPSVALAALEASAPIKVEAALLLHGLAPS